MFDGAHTTIESEQRDQVVSTWQRRCDRWRAIGAAKDLNTKIQRLKEPFFFFRVCGGS